MGDEALSVPSPLAGEGVFYLLPREGLGMRVDAKSEWYCAEHSRLWRAVSVVAIWYVFGAS